MMRGNPKHLLLVIVVLFFRASGITQEGRVYTKDHFNVTIAVDLSNRLSKPKPVDDDKIVKLILDKIYPDVLKLGNRETDQLDRFHFDFINRNQINTFNANMQLLDLDFSRFGNKQYDRISYILGKAPRKFSADKELFLKEFSRIKKLAVSNSSGCDIWTYFDEKIDRVVVRQNAPDINFSGKTYRNNYRNILVLITDGYIESKIYTGNVFLSGSKVNDFRRQFLKVGASAIEDFYKEYPWKIKKAENNLLSNLEVLVLEIDDRSLTSNGQATVHPTDERIIKLFWEDWFKRSKVKRWELHPIASSVKDVEATFLNFIK